MPETGSNSTTLLEAVTKYAHLLQDRSAVAPGDLLGRWTRTTDYLKAHGLTPAIAEKYRLGFVNPARKIDRPHAGDLMIPYMTKAGIVTYRYRCTKNHVCKDVEFHNKYDQPKGIPLHIFNPQAFFDAGNTIGIAEGEIDAIAATEILDLPTVGIPGIEAWKSNHKSWKRCFDDYENVIVWVDNDPPSRMYPQGPGKAMAGWIQDDIGGDRCLLVTCDQGEDVSSMVAKGHSDVLRERAGLGGSMGRMRGDSQII